MGESTRDQSRALVDAESWMRPSLEVVLDEVRGHLDVHTSLLYFSHKMFRYELDRALHYYICPFLVFVLKHTATFRSVSSSQADTLGYTLHQSASSVISSLDHRLSSSAAASQSGSTNYS